VFSCSEHVPGDRAAIRDIWRVLRVGGQAILQVPVDLIGVKALNSRDRDTRTLAAASCGPARRVTGPNGSMSSPRYVVISPVRDEEQYLPMTIASMCAQVLKPWRWVLVDDGSSDRTGELIDEAAARHPWILAVHGKDRGSRQAGSGVIAAFNEGYARIANDRWDYVVKFDGDLSFGPQFFADCLREFEADASLGIAGGTCCILRGGRIVPEFEGEPAFHVRGPTKIYRRACFAAIGGLITAPGWDTVDQIKANMLGWKSMTFPHIRLVHLRSTGGAYGSWSNWVKNGLANYIAGYHPMFMACKCVRRMVRFSLLEGCGLWCGFMKGYVSRTRRVEDEAMIRYLRREQWHALTFRSSLWR
jgi:poly-beta-1,6-N-acetyl-D-glucosamine synthase